MPDLAGGRRRAGMRVLIGCEYSGRMRRAFQARGNEAWSCDLLPAEDGCTARHHVGDVVEFSRASAWDLCIFHPPCTDLAVSGARWWASKGTDAAARARALVLDLWNVGCPRVAIENPIGRLSTLWRKPNQIVQPWWFGDGECKATCWWTRGLPRLVPTQIVDGRGQSVHREPPGPDRWKNRSRTFEGMARACAEQWGHTTQTQTQKQMELNLDTET